MKKSVYMLLTNPINTGFVNHKGKLYPGEHEALVDEATWNLVQSNLHHNGHTNGGGNKNKYGALLRGLLFCVPCGAPMVHTYTAREPKLYRYYVCYKAQQKGWKSCETKSISATSIENAVVDSIRALGANPKLAAAVIAGLEESTRARRADLERQREIQSRKLQQLNADLAREAADRKGASAARFDSILALQRETEEVEHKLSNLDTEGKAMEPDASDCDDLRRTLEQFEPVWDSLGTREKEKVIRTLVTKVGYDGPTGKLMIAFRHAAGKDICPRKREQVVASTWAATSEYGFQIETVLVRRNRPRRMSPEPALAPTGPVLSRLLRITRLMALAIQIQERIERRELHDYAEVARVGYVTRARMTQIMNLLHLAPDIQEAILFPGDDFDSHGMPHGRALRDLCLEVKWKNQRRIWSEALVNGSAVANDIL